MGGTRRSRVEPTDEREQLKFLCGWPEQLAHEEIRPAVLFGSSERTLYRKASAFDRVGMDSLFDSAGAKRRELPPVVRRMIAERKTEYPGCGLGEIATICYVRTGRRPGKHTIERVLAEEPVPLRMLRRFERYREILEPGLSLDALRWAGADRRFRSRRPPARSCARGSIARRRRSFARCS